MSDLTFYIDHISQPGRAILALLRFGNIKFEEKVINIFKRENKQPDFLKIHPLGTVPALVHGKLALGESNAILTYLCDAFPKELGKYAGNSIEQRALVQQYLSWYQGTYRPSIVGPLRVRLTALFNNGIASNAEIQLAKKRMIPTLDLIDKLLGEGRSYIVGQNITIADLILFEETTDLEIYQFDFSAWKNLKAWYDRMLTNQILKAIHQRFRDGLPAVGELLATIPVQ